MLASIQFSRKLAPGHATRLDRSCAVSRTASARITASERAFQAAKFQNVGHPAHFSKFCAALEDLFLSPIVGGGSGRRSHRGSAACRALLLDMLLLGGACL